MRSEAILSDADDLARLVETEDRIARRMAEVRLEADRIREDAGARAGAIEERARQEIDAALEDRTRSLEQDCAREVEAIAERARIEARRFETIGEERIAALAREIVARLAGAPPGSGGTRDDGVDR